MPSFGRGGARSGSMMGRRNLPGTGRGFSGSLLRTRVGRSPSTSPTTQGHWAVMPLPEDQLRALSLRAFARAKAQGVRPTRVRNKDPLKPLPVPGKFLRPIVDPERAPPRPKDGIGI